MHKNASDEQILSNFALELTVSIDYGIFSMVERPVYGH